MNTETAVAKPNTVKALLASPAYQNRFKELLKDNAAQFMASVIQVTSQSRMLANCDPHSVIAAAVTAAALDLPVNPNLGFAWIIPYKDKASFQLGYKGLVQLANRSGQYKRLNVITVYEGELDPNDYDRLRGEVVLKRANRKSDKVVGYAAYFMLINGHEHAEFWDVDTVRAHAKRFSQAYRAGKQDSPWFTDFDAMARKTVLKSLLSHYGPLSVAMQRAVTEDGSSRQLPEGDIEFPDTAPDAPASEPIEATASVSASDETQPSKATEPRKTRAQLRGEAKNKVVGEPTPQTELETFVTKDCAATFDQLVKFLVTSGNDVNAESYPSFAEIPKELATRLLRSKAGLKQMLTENQG